MRLGIRAQLLVWLAASLVLAFVPLMYAIASLARASFTQTWDDQSRSLGRAIAAHVSEASAHRTDEELGMLLEAQLGNGVGAIGVYDGSGLLSQRAGGELSTHLPERVVPRREQVQDVTTPAGPALLVLVPGPRGVVGALLFHDATSSRVAPLLSLIALYVGILGLALLFIVYFILTRVVVGPVEHLSRGARRVAEGARELAVPPRGGRELVELGVSLATMTATLRAEEEQLRSYVGELETAHADLTRAQDTVMRSERLASVGRLAAGLAHEIGNPIAAILSMQELLLDGELDDEQRDFLQRMKRETERIHRILRDLLDFARPAATGLGEGTELETASVKGAVEQVVALVRPQKALADVELVVAVADGLPSVAMRQERIEQVLLNLLLNAADAVPRPGGRIRVGARAGARDVTIVIEDNGGGIAPSVRGRLFEPFVTTKDVGKGTGLGLAVCRGLVESAGGAIAVEDGEEGARFSVSLPLAPTGE